MGNKPQITFWSSVLDDLRFGLKFKFSKKKDETSCETEIFCESGQKDNQKEIENNYDAMTVGDMADELS